MNVYSLLKEQVAPVLGCTEPGSIGLACADAFRILGGNRKTKPGEISKIRLTIDRNVLKNALSVGIPRTGGKTGIDLAAATAYQSAWVLISLTDKPASF